MHPEDARSSARERHREPRNDLEDQVDTEKDYYAILGVLPSIDGAAIQAVYRALLKKYHPDVFGGSKVEGEIRTREIVQAFEVLGNPGNRKAYDDARRTNGFEHKERTAGCTDEATVDWELVYNEPVYRKLLEVLLRSGFRLRARDFSKKNSLFAQFTETLPSVLNSMRKKLIYTYRDEFYDLEQLQQRMNELHEWAAVVCVKYVLDWPVIVTVVNADHLTHSEIVRLANRFGKASVAIKGLSPPSPYVSSMGIMLLLFSDHALASDFIEHTQDKCKIPPVVPWVVDVPNRTVHRHRGLPSLLGILRPNYLQKEVFQKG